ncbi:MAG: hypothetical protein Q7W05_11705 [Deltaproteobacteria bacterium]|nr:hypothetical protein [Deltaproteobacteria bacterium]
MTVMACKKYFKKFAARGMVFLLLVMVSIASAELVSRVFWSRYSVPLLDPGRILYAYYPEMMQVEHDKPSKGDGHYNVLMLGGSVIHPEWGSVADELKKQLIRSGRQNVRIYNLAKPGHTSRDSWLKYTRLISSHFDLVVFYHGINDARANNAPPEIYKDDYSHYVWYEMVNAMAGYHGSARCALPCTLCWLVISINQVFNKDRYIPFNNLREEWVKYGGDIRSAKSFQLNLKGVLDTALSREDQIMIMTFAAYAPKESAPEEVEWPLEKWGEPENVLLAEKAHNDIVKKFANHDTHILFVDQAGLIPGVPSYFQDSCHLTEAGSRKFVENMIKVLSVKN